MRLLFTFSALVLLIIPINAFSQNYQWAKSIGSANADHGRFIAIDSIGNVFITGSFQSAADFDPGPGTAILASNGAEDVFLAKYDANGNYLWAKSIGSSLDDVGYGIEVDKNGNVLVTGYFQGTADFDPSASAANLISNGSYDIFFAKYDTNGNYVWAKSMGSAAIDYGSAVKVDNIGNVFIVGVFGGTTDFDPNAGIFNLTPAGGFDVLFAKYDVNGNFAWAKNVGGSLTDYISNIELDNAGNVYITGYFQGTSDFDPSASSANLTSVGNYDVFFAKYDTGGNYIWAKSIGSPLDDYGTCVNPDKQGNVYVTGYFQGSADFDGGTGIQNLTSGGSSDIYVGKYDPNGNYLWARTFGSSGSDYGYFVEPDTSGYICLTGLFQGNIAFGGGCYGTTASHGLGDIFITKLDADGNLLWARNMGFASDDAGAVDSTDDKGNFYMTGYFQGTVDFDPGTGVANQLSTGLQDIFFGKYTDLIASQPVSICIVTVDSTSSKNIIIWDKPVTTSIDSFRIYRDSGTGYIPIVTIPYAALSADTDNVNPNVRFYDYKISAIDNSGIESALSDRVETMWLQVTQPNAPAFDMTWNDYCGFPVAKYYIERDSNNTNSWARIDSVSWGTNMYVDSFPPTDSANYRIEAIVPSPCSALVKDPLPDATTVKGSKSNSDNKLSTPPFSVGEYSAYAWLNVYPNPTRGNLGIEIKDPGFTKASLLIYDVLGNIVVKSLLLTSRSQILLPKISAGIYHLQVVTHKGTANTKIVVE